MAIRRVWHGWTRRGDAEAYEALLLGTIFPAIEAKAIAGLRRLELLRRELTDEVEFAVQMEFDALADVERFAGPDPTLAWVPDAAREVLSRWDDRAAHFEVRATRPAGRA